MPTSRSTARVSAAFMVKVNSRRLRPFRGGRSTVSAPMFLSRARMKEKHSSLSVERENTMPLSEKFNVPAVCRLADRKARPQQGLPS